MTLFAPFFVLITALHICFAPPVTQKKEAAETSDLSEFGIEYHKYLKEVVDALESDPEFKKKLEAAEEHHIRSGQIADELEFVEHHVRTKLDEIKRVEMQRLLELVEKKRQLEGETNDLNDPTHHRAHLDHSNPHTFEIEDLKRLINRTTEDLAEADRKRQLEFKEYELKKEYDKQYKLNHTQGSEHEKLEKEYKELEEKHKKHEKLHEPGHKAQLEEVWHEQDQMQQEFDPKTFFMLHDTDGNGLWDQNEVKALFIKELEKMYAEGHPEDDMRERIEEMEKMREAVFREEDLNRDGFIDYHEFSAQTKRSNFEQDKGWQGLDENKPYTDEELEQYIRQHQAYPVPPGQFHPGQVPQYVPQHLPDINTNEINGNYQHYPVPQQQYHLPPPNQQQYQPPPNQQQHQPPPNQQQYQPPPNQQQYHPPPNQQQYQPPPNQQQYQPPPNQQLYQDPPNQQQQPSQNQQQQPSQKQQQQPPQSQQQQYQPPPNQPAQQQVNQQNPSNPANIPQNNQKPPQVNQI